MFLTQSVESVTWKKKKNKSSRSGKKIKSMDNPLIIILGVAGCYAYFFWKDYKNKKEIKKQERLNAIKTN